MNRIYHRRHVRRIAADQPPSSNTGRVTYGCAARDSAQHHNQPGRGYGLTPTRAGPEEDQPCTPS